MNPILLRELTATNFRGLWDWKVQIGDAFSQCLLKEKSNRISSDVALPSVKFLAHNPWHGGSALFIGSPSDVLLVNLLVHEVLEVINGEIQS